MSALTLEEICENAKLSPKALDQKCTNEGLDILAEYCVDWEEVAKKLIPSNSDNLIDEVGKKKPRYQRSEFLRRWKEEHGSRATYKKFFKALLELKFTEKVENAIEKLKKLLEQHPKELADAAGGSRTATDSSEEQKNIALDSEPELTEKHLTILTDLLKDLNAQNLRTLGSALGLSYTRQKKLADPLNDMVSSWLSGLDNVVSDGKDTRDWNGLIKALEQCYMGGTAARVRKHAAVLQVGSLKQTPSKYDVKKHEERLTEGQTSGRSEQSGVPLAGYISRIPKENQYMLKEKLDFQHGGVEKHLAEIADAFVDWDTNLANLMGLTRIEVSDILSVNIDKPILQRRSALRKWREKNGLDATYGRILEICLKGNNNDCADVIIMVLGGSPEKGSHTSAGSHIEADSGVILEAIVEKAHFSEEEQKQLCIDHEPDPQSREEEEELVAFCKEIVVILHVANDNEYEAAITYITAPNQQDKKAKSFRGYEIGIFAEQKVKVALIRTRQGTNAGKYLKDAIDNLFSNVQFIIAVGVCYSFDREKHNLGDVLISNRITEVKAPKFTDGASGTVIDIEFRDECIKMDGYLERVFCFKKNFWKDYKVSADRCSKAYCGLFISGSFLINSKHLRDILKSKQNEAIGGEMEGCKLLEIQESLKKKIIIIKGVADYADGKKDKKWQFTAAMAAFNYVEKMINKEGANFPREHCIGRAEGIGKETSATSVPFQAHTGTRRIAEDSGEILGLVGGYEVMIARLENLESPRLKQEQNRIIDRFKLKLKEFQHQVITKESLKIEWEILEAEEAKLKAQAKKAQRLQTVLVQALLNEHLGVLEMARNALIKYFNGEKTSRSQVLDFCGSDIDSYKVPEKYLAYTPLMMALEEGKIDIAKKLIELGASGAYSNKKGQTAVHLAAKEGQLDVLQELYRMLVPSSDDDDRPDMERLFVATDKEGWNVLHYACAEGHKTLLDWLLKTIPELKTWEYLNQKSVSGYTPLLVACENIEEKILKYLLEDEKLVKLVDFKACTNITGGDGNKTGLHLAATYDMDEMARLLIKGGCLIDAKDAKGNTALHIAVAKSSTSVASILRGSEGGAKLDRMENDAGKVPGDISPEKGFIIPAEIEKRGPEAKAIYTKALQEGNCKIPYCKLLILGQERMGKSSLYRQLAGQPFDENLIPTRGIDNNVLNGIVDMRQLSIEWKEKESGTCSIFVQKFASLLEKELPTVEKRGVEEVSCEELKEKTQGIISEIESMLKQPLHPQPSRSSESFTKSEPSSKSKSESSSKSKSESSSKSKSEPSTTTTPAQLHPPIQGIGRKQQSNLDFRLRKGDTNVSSLVLNALDFAGQKKYRSMHHCFISRRALYAVVFKIPDMIKYKRKTADCPTVDPFQELRYWLHSIHAHLDPKEKDRQNLRRVFLVGTHRNDFGSADDLDEINALFEKDKASRYRNHIHMHKNRHFFAVENSIDKESSSNYLTESGIKDLQDELKKTLEELPFLKEDHPVNYLCLEDWIEDLRISIEPTPITDLIEIRKLAKKCGLRGEKKQDEAFQFLHDTGKILLLRNLPRLFLAHNEHKELENLVVLRRSWLFEAMAVIMELKSETIKELSNIQSDTIKQGVADEDALLKCWMKFISQDDNPAERFKHLCLILQAYCLIYPIPEEAASYCHEPVLKKARCVRKYLIPCKLPELSEELKNSKKLRPELSWFSMDFNFRKFLPAEIYYQLVCFLLTSSETDSPPDQEPNFFTSTVCVLYNIKDSHWKIEYERDSHRLIIAITPSRGDKLKHIRDIHENYLSKICEDSNLERLMYYGGPLGVKCSHCSNSQLPYVSYGGNRKMEKSTDFKVKCENCLEETNINDELAKLMTGGGNGVKGPVPVLPSGPQPKHPAGESDKNSTSQSTNYLSTADHFEICRYLKDLDDDDLIELGTALGLLFPNLKKMKKLPQDMVQAWINKKDNVLKVSGVPSWNSLITALEKINQNGVAATLKEEKMQHLGKKKEP